MKKEKEIIKRKQPAVRSSRTPVKAKAFGTGAKEKSFYIVAMGGSAGGLEAFRRFFSHTPPDSGMAFVLVSHLNPTQKSMLCELLQRATKMPVFLANDGMKVLPNGIYVIPPNKDMSILNGTLQLLQPLEPRGLRLPVDYFFCQLAEDQGELAIAIILSGMGSDGSLGIKSIKEKLGMVMAQELSSAQFDSMPRNAIATGLVDYIAPVEEMPVILHKYTHHLSTLSSISSNTKMNFTNALQKITVLIRDHTGNDFSGYKQSTLIRRIERRMSIHHIRDTNRYVRFLQENPHEIELLFKELLVGVTSFFRETEAFDTLREEAIPLMLKSKPLNNTFRVWVPGCSTGEEAYSLAIILLECLEKLEQNEFFKIKFFCTDIDKDAIGKARLGIYPFNIEGDVSPLRLQRFFIKTDNGYQVKNEIREMLIFAAHNVGKDPPFTRIDLISCRNVLIYMTVKLQEKVFHDFHFSLNPGGLLFLGSAESVGACSDLFSLLNNTWKIFMKKEYSTARRIATAVPLPATSKGINNLSHMNKPVKNSESHFQVRIKDFLIEHLTPPVVVINENGDILYISGRTGKYLEPAVGKTNINIFAMEREGLSPQLGIAIRSAISLKKEVTMKGLKVKTNGDYQSVDLAVKPYSTTEGHRKDLFVVVFQDVAASSNHAESDKEKAGRTPRQNQIVTLLKNELSDVRRTLQLAIEENESLRAEFKSATEEMQVTNEDLTTSKEELQSTNEELVTVNSELLLQMEGFTRISNDMSNLISNINVATIFLDGNLNIKQFTPQARKIINIIPSDVCRPITHFATNKNRAGCLMI
ncbi:MAG: methyltransferase/methylesterase, CheR/CheB with sensor [Candidatus Brocadiaceae bacterium]|nr:methyltransferase/methylesterase, CheR/CheB with sensor [Candidatus Brocadiaceae bacterium]